MRKYVLLILVMISSAQAIDISIGGNYGISIANNDRSSIYTTDLTIDVGAKELSLYGAWGVLYKTQDTFNQECSEYPGVYCSGSAASDNSLRGEYIQGGISVIPLQREKYEAGIQVGFRYLYHIQNEDTTTDLSYANGLVTDLLLNIKLGKEVTIVNKLGLSYGIGLGYHIGIKLNF